MRQKRRAPQCSRLRLGVVQLLASTVFYLIEIFSFASAFAQASPDQVATPSVLISVSIIDDHGNARGTAQQDTTLGLRFELAESSLANGDLSPANSRVTLPRAALFHHDKTPKRIEVVVWLDPRHFSLESHHHGLLDLARTQSAVSYYDVLATPDPGSATEGAISAKMPLHVRKVAPLNETSTVGILLLSDDELVADFALPLKVTKSRNASRGASISSPFRPNGPPGDPSDEGVLTLIELRRGLVQLTFACASGIRSWRVYNERPLKDWPKYLDNLIERTNLATTASTFSGLLFPTGSDCKTRNCADAASFFDTWARRAAEVELPPTLTVQTLPSEEDDAFSPVLMPVGMLPITNEAQRTSLPEEQNETANEVPLATPGDTALSDPALHPELLSVDGAGPLLEVGESPKDVLDRKVDEVVTLKDPADPEFEVNRRIATLMDPAAPNKSRGRRPPPSDTRGSNEQSTRYLAYIVVAHSPVHRSTAATTNSRACASAWSILVPPQEGQDSPLVDAREPMRVLFDLWNRIRFQYAASLTPLTTEEFQPAKITSAWMIVSHFDSDLEMLYMWRPNGKDLQRIPVAELRRKLAPPGVVVLLACQTAVPATHTFLGRLLDNGASTLILTSAPVPGKAAGWFATAFIGVLGEAGAAGISITEAFRETLTRLPDYLQEYVPRFILAGDPNVRLCAPPLVR